MKSSSISYYSYSFSYYIKKAVSQIGNVVITIKPYVMKNYLVQMTNGHFFIISSDLNYKVGDFMAVVHNVVSVVQVGIQIRDGRGYYDVTSSRVDVLD
jgi:hypothetical protein